MVMLETDFFKKIRIGAVIAVIAVGTLVSCERKHADTNTGGEVNGSTEAGYSRSRDSSGAQPADKTSVTEGDSTANKMGAAGNVNSDATQTGAQGEVKGTSSGTNSGSSSETDIKSNESKNPVRSNSGPVNQDSVNSNNDRLDQDKVSGEGEWDNTRKDTLRKN